MWQKDLSRLLIRVSIGIGLCVFPTHAFASVADSTVKDSVSSDSLEVIVSNRTRAIAVLAWPFENVLQPTFNAILYPIKPPLLYVMRNQVIDRGVALITLGDHNQVMLYPTFNLKPGTSSSLGVTYRHRGLLSETGKDNWVNIYSKFINGDWDVRSKYSRSNLFGTTLKSWAAVRVRQDRDAMVSVTGFQNHLFQYADSSWDLRGGISNPLNTHWNWEFSAGVEHKLFSEPEVDVAMLPRSQDSLDVFDYRLRGMYQEFWQYPLAIQFNYNTKDSDHAPTEGSLAAFYLGYVPVSNYWNPLDDGLYNNTLSHNYYVMSAVYQTYFLIGKRQYTLTRAESKANQKYLQGMSLEKTLQLLGPEQLRETLLERKILAIQFRMRQMWDADPGGAPFVGLSELNSNAPLRGYNRSYFDFNVYSLSCEYRWPLVDLVDGVVFNEYGLFGKSWSNPEWSNLRNSWGFGIRVRKPNLFLTRLQIGFHGLQGVNLILTINPEFQS